MNIYNPKMHKNTFESLEGQLIWNFINSLLGIELMKFVSDKKRPAAEGISYILQLIIGVALTDDQKKATGNMIRFVMEENGYKHVEYGVTCNENPSGFRLASRYEK